MKKITAIFLAIILLFVFGACQKKELTPAEKLDAYIVANGVQEGETYVLDCPIAAEKIKDSDFTIAHMQNLKTTPNMEFKIVKTAKGITLVLLDSSITDNGIKMERSVTLSPDGRFKFYNGLVMDGKDLGLHFEGEIPMETYTKDHKPVITDSKLGPGAKLNDAAKDTLKDYIDLTIDCYSIVLSQEGLGITLTDVGYSAFTAN